MTDVRLIFNDNDIDQYPGIALELSCDEFGMRFGVINESLSHFIGTFMSNVMKDHKSFLKKAANISTMFEFFDDDD